jgi:hypothetical protein
MGWLRAVTQKKQAQATALSQLKEELRPVTQNLESREGELAEALEQQTATSEILRAIESSPTDIHRCSTPYSRDRRVCNATDSPIVRIDGDVLLPPIAKYSPSSRRTIPDAVLWWTDEAIKRRVSGQRAGVAELREEKHA